MLLYLENNSGEIANTIEQKNANNLLDALGGKQNIYSNKNLKKEDINNIQDIVENNEELREALGKRKKNFIRILTELAQNAYDHAIINKNNKSELHLEIFLEDNNINIITKNNFKSKEEKVEELKKSFDSTNKLEFKDVKEKRKQKSYDGNIENNGYSGAGLGILFTAKVIKRYKEGTVFEHNIEKIEGKNNIYKINLTTKFPLEEKQNIQ